MPKSKCLVPIEYGTLKAIICPDTSWVENIPLEKGREEANAILDIFIELCKLMKSQGKQIREAQRIRKTIDNIKSMSSSVSPETRLTALEKIWLDLTREAYLLGFVPEYDPETDRMILIKKELLDLKESFNSLGGNGEKYDKCS